MRPEKRIACGVAVAAAIVVATTAFFGWRTYECVHAPSGGTDVIELQISLQCDGWTPENAELGVFVSGAQLDGAPCDEQLVFEGAGEQIAYLGAGSYEIVPQLPTLMLRDGTVLAATDPVARSYGDGAPATDRLDVVYGIVDSSSMTDDELRETAESSFASEEDAAEALERALARGDGEGRYDEE